MKLLLRILHTVLRRRSPDASSDHADSDHFVDIHPNARATEAPDRWTPDEDAELQLRIPQEEMGARRKRQIGLQLLRLHSRSIEEAVS
jgi:hypothetical protein